MEGILTTQYSMLDLEGHLHKMFIMMCLQLAIYFAQVFI